MNKSSKDEFIGFDLGHGETAIGRAFGGAVREPEILEFRGERSFVTAIAKTKDGVKIGADAVNLSYICLLYTSPSPRDATLSRMPSSA